ncbi:copper resistance protein CopC (plasmid) [Gemmobacter fulvus]|uniref:Copper resistance protein CopC n=1 Tax=Gemmobacter fulvus TaxID=2840474 RepID=A0A975P9M9_9RHOB|nr:copper resistance CopC family protein [Gemmobacter fulvus]MBT9246298.1 copper resistance protein CopC [Gemmobacter fulvus]QWK92349.1 copper resistance protein CopC [Gemmobacter fulvus]
MRILSSLLLLVLLFIAPVAHAHAQLQKSLPTAEAVIAALPDSVTLTFSEPVAPLVLRWILPDGREVDAEASLRGNDLVVVPTEAGAGSYLLSWRVASTDGHPMAGCWCLPWARRRAAMRLRPPRAHRRLGRRRGGLR